MSSQPPVWAMRSGVPPAHIVRASLHAASLIDASGSPVPLARDAYSLYASDALFPPHDLQLGESLLVDCGFLTIREDALYPTELLGELLELDELEAVAIVMERAVLASARRSGSTSSTWQEQMREEGARVLDEFTLGPERREALLTALSSAYDSAWREALGARGEESVADAARAELMDLGRADLAARVVRYGGVADSLGYDVMAPRLSGERRLEVKTTTRDVSGGLLHFFISRNEYERGLSDPDWALVFCYVDGTDDVQIRGWCRARTLTPYLPADGEGARWTAAEAEVPAALFQAGLPAVA